MNQDSRGDHRDQGHENRDWRKVELILRFPEVDKNFMVGFNTVRGENALTSAYNEAIDDVLRNAELNPFHQVGGDDDPGYHAWEVWKKVDEETIRSLFDQIQTQAKQIFEDRS